MTLDSGTLVGLPWDEAEPRLAARGLTIRTQVIHPPGRPCGTGELRVVAVRAAAPGWLVILAHRSYAAAEPAGGTAPDTPTAR